MIASRIPTQKTQITPRNCPIAQEDSAGGTDDSFARVPA